jgi:hypothetical protein
MMVKQYNNNRRYKKPIKRREKDKDMNAKKCLYCGTHMKYKGPGNSAGAVYWKCRNKQCGRTLWIKHYKIKEVIPLTIKY